MSQKMIKFRKLYLQSLHLCLLFVLLSDEKLLWMDTFLVLALKTLSSGGAASNLDTKSRCLPIPRYSTSHILHN